MSGLERLEYVKPAEIEARSFQIIGRELEERGYEPLDPENEQVIKRCIHTSADFDYADNLCFSQHAVRAGVRAFAQGASVVTDTKMAWSGINKRVLEKLGGRAYNFMSEPSVADGARRRGLTRSAVCMEHAAALGVPLIYAVGNAPTALVRLCEMLDAGEMVRPALVVGVPVGFVNVVESKELIMERDVPYIVARGRKGGSNIAAAIVNALLYEASGNERE